MEKLCRGILAHVDAGKTIVVGGFYIYGKSVVARGMWIIRMRIATPITWRAGAWNYDFSKQA